MASSKDPDRVRLDHAEGGGHRSGTGGSANLASSPAAKKKAAGYIENHLAPDTKKAGAHADLDTSGVTGASSESRAPMSPSLQSPAGGSSILAGPFEGWALRAGLSKAHTAWEKQLKNLLNRLVSERDALHGAKKTLHGGDSEIGDGVQSVKPRLLPRSKLNDY